MTTRFVRSSSGFSLVELLFATALMLVVSGIVTTALSQMTRSQTTIWNRTEMHSGIRGATELLQQEVGQAGRISLPTPITLTGGAAKSVGACDPNDPAVNVRTGVQVSSTTGLWATTTGPAPSQILLTTMDGDNSETIRLAALSAGSPGTIDACFANDHLPGTPVMALGGFATGIVPPSGVLNPSTATVLKMYGDINGDGNMVYIEYTCDAAAHKLYRNVMAFTDATKPPLTDSNILLSNVMPNPGTPPTDCFTYQTASAAVGTTPYTFVLDVAITLTVQTQQIDPITRQYQTETKALLNVSPRNIYNAYAYAGMNYGSRIQPMPPTVANLTH